MRCIYLTCFSISLLGPSDSDEGVQHTSNATFKRFSSN